MKETTIHNTDSYRTKSGKHNTSSSVCSSTLQLNIVFKDIFNKNNHFTYHVEKFVYIYCNFEKRLILMDSTVSGQHYCFHLSLAVFIPGALYYNYCSTVSVDQPARTLMCAVAWARPSLNT